MDNPLLSVQFDVPFDKIRAEHIEPATDKLLEEARAAVTAIAESTGPRTYENTLGALEAATERLEFAMNVVSSLESVATTDALRAAYNTARPKVSAFYSGIPLDPGLWKALSEFANTPEAAALTGAKKRHLTKTLDDFRRHGADLPPEGKARLQELDVELTKVTTTFSQNVLDATNAWELVIEDRNKLAGLPESALEAARESAKEQGKKGYRFTLHAPSLIPVLTYLDDPAIRRQVWEAHYARGTEGDTDNRELVAKILRLRKERAKILGFGTFADLVLADRMAKRGGRAQEFVGELRHKTRPFFDSENDALLAFRRGLPGGEDADLEPWDLGYYAEKQRKELYAFDEEEVRAYFPVDRVMEGLFVTVERLYGVHVKELTDVPTWHPTVRAYRLEGANGAHIGSFYVDLFPRDDKRGGAWMAPLITDVTGGPQLGLFCANVSPPVGDTPALLRHREVETLFHEFGHLMHHLLTDVPVRSLAGTNVAWDFVELPSQIMENWCWEPEALNLFARHYETDAVLPEELYQKMAAARNYRAANAQMRQLGFASMDLGLHIDWDPDRTDHLEYARAVLADHSPTPLPENHAMASSFLHLFGSPVGYAAGYYSYKWAEVLDADAFLRFKENGVFNADVGTSFREHILEKGDSEDPLELYKGFMGREPSIDALFERQGLSP
ncbi:MAG: M3 family metallopeptidase [Myxococcota bacterium]